MSKKSAFDQRPSFVIILLKTLLVLFVFFALAKLSGVTTDNETDEDYFNDAFYELMCR